jgi:hypothetical protein
MILLIGGNGSIGRRYQSVIRALEYPFEIYDNPKHKAGDPWNKNVSHALICTPTETHTFWAKECARAEIPFLCEKPFSKRPSDALRFKDAKAFVVNNYNFLPCAQVPRKIYYNFYNTGKDGLVWDVCQLVYLAWKNGVELEVTRDSFWWDMKWGQHQVPYNDIERSYYYMVKAFMTGDATNLWDMHDAAHMSEMCNELNERVVKDVEYFIWKPNPGRNTSQERIFSLAAKGLSKDRG